MQQRNPKQLFKSLQIIHLALLGGQLMFAIVAFIVSQDQATAQADKSFEMIMLLAVPMVAMGGVTASLFLTRAKLKALPSKPDLMAKLTEYQYLTILRLALLEGPSLFALVAMLLTANPLFLLFAAGLMVYFATLRPSLARLTQDLKLSAQDLRELS
jgi:hypothetical protein